jgi:hypothetical protein
MSLFTEPTFEELAQIFAMSEEEQGKYFPLLQKNVWVEYGSTIQAETRFARFIALCALSVCAKAAELSRNPEIAQLGSELSGLAWFVNESSASWEFLIWHPRDVRLGNDASGTAVIPEVYVVWAVIRRLCKQVIAILNPSRPPRPFAVAFADLLITPLE